jgi:DNA-binding PadR family transcriptional regulator
MDSDGAGGHRFSTPLLQEFLNPSLPPVVISVAEILQGSFYTAIYRLERRGWIQGEWGESENDRKAKFYRLTAAGKRQLKAETRKWTDMASVVADILQAKPEGV